MPSLFANFLLSLTGCIRPIANTSGWMRNMLRSLCRSRGARRLVM